MKRSGESSKKNANPRKKSSSLSEGAATQSEESSDSARETTTHIDDLPLEMLCHILGFLTFSEQLKLATVSRHWRQAVNACLARHRHFSKKLLSGRYYVSNQLLEKILSRLPGLHKLDAVIGTTDLDVDIICRHCPLLEDASLYSFQVDVPLLERVCRSCPKLTKLALPKTCDDACVETVLRNLPGLRSLDIELENITGRCLSLLPTGLQCLKLHGDWSRRLRPTEVAQAARCPALKELFLSCYEEPPDCLIKLLEICPKLERLDATDFYLSDAFLKQLPEKTPGIRHLILASSNNVTSAGLKSLRHLKELRTLDLFNTDTTDDVLEQLQGAPHLTELTVGLEANRGTLCSEEALARLVTSCPSLKTVNLAYGIEVGELFDLLDGQLSADRDVKLVVDEGMLENLEEMEMELPENGPLRVVAYEESDNE